MNSIDNRPLKTRLLAESGVLISMYLMSLWAWQLIPAGDQMSVHWGLSGQPDGYMPKAYALLVLPVITAFVCVVSNVAMNDERYQAGLEKSRLVADIAMFGVLLLLAVTHGMIILSAMGHVVPVPQIVFTGVGTVLAAVGGLMAAGKTAPNGCVGVRTPWTMASESCWQKTNRLGGLVMFVMGLGCIVGGITFNLVLMLISILGGSILSLCVYPYSYYCWISEQR